MSALRRFYWRQLRRYAYEICQACGRPVALSCPSYWTAPDGLWLKVEGSEGGIRCIPCFTHDAERTGRHVYWEAKVDR